MPSRGSRPRSTPRPRRLVVQPTRLLQRRVAGQPVAASFGSIRPLALRSRRPRGSRTRARPHQSARSISALDLHPGALIQALSLPVSCRRCSPNARFAKLEMLAAERPHRSLPVSDIEQNPSRPPRNIPWRESHGLRRAGCLYAACLDGRRAILRAWQRRRFHGQPDRTH